MNGAIQIPGTTPAASMSRGECVERSRELVLAVEPVADPGLEAVVELEHVEGPVVAAREVGADVVPR